MSQIPLDGILTKQDRPVPSTTADYELVVSETNMCSPCDTELSHSADPKHFLI